MKTILCSIAWMAGVMFTCSLHFSLMLIYFLISGILALVWNKKLDHKL
jgi:hypothetical protein